MQSTNEGEERPRPREEQRVQIDRYIEDSADASEVGRLTSAPRPTVIELNPCSAVLKVVPFDMIATAATNHDPSLDILEGVVVDRICAHVATSCRKCQTERQHCAFLEIKGGSTNMYRY